MDEDFPWATTVLLLAILATAWLVTGFLPTEASLAQLWWSRETMADGEWWRLFTAMFAHAGLLHLGFNAIALISMAQLERELGTVAFATIYLASGLGGGMAHIIASPIPTVGASGAIFGMLGVILVLAPKMELYVLGLPIPAIVALSLYLSVVLLVPAFSDALPIAHWAHIGGMVVGMAGGFGVEPRRAVPHLAYVAAVFLATLVLVGSLTSHDAGALLELFQREGLLAVLAETWLTWLSLLAIYATLTALDVWGPGRAEA